MELKNKLKERFPLLLEVYRYSKRKLLIIKDKVYEITPAFLYPYILKVMYYHHTSAKLDWNNLTTYNEKMQWSKLYNTFPLKSELSDKLAVKDWVANKIGSEYLIPTLESWRIDDEINFSLLPDEFILKYNNGSSCNYIVKDKNKESMSQINKMIKQWTERNFAYVNGFELHYQDIPPMIFAEKLLKSEEAQIDYRFLCFNGKVHLCWVDIEEDGVRKRNMYDRDWNRSPVYFERFDDISFDFPKPEKFDEMVHIAEVLSEEFDQVRVDLYYIDEKIYFGEMTFTNGSGFTLIEPYEMNKYFGDLWELPLG